MTKRFISLADLANPEGYHERRRREELTDIKRGELDLKAQVETYRFRQEDAHHRDSLEQAERHHADKMNALSRADELDTRKLDAMVYRDREQLELGRDRLALDRENASVAAQTANDRLAFDREHAAMVAETAHDTALIQARTSLEVERMRQEGAVRLSELSHGQAVTLSQLSHAQSVELAKLSHRQTVALSELEHIQALDLAREQARIVSADATTNLLREKALSTIRRGEDAAKHIHGAIGSILVEKVRGRITERLEDQKERHRANERRHEKEMAENTARYSRVGFTAEELVRAGFSIKEATIIVERFIAGLGARDDDEAAIFAKFDQWYEASKQ